jgi:hypothetical protein
MPLLVMSIASLSGHLTLASGFEWIGTYEALGAFAAASFLEISAYYIPWVDNLLDTVAVPAATVAGTVVMASSVSEMSPLLQWALAVIVGGGVAGTIQGFTTITRMASTATTGGLGNFVVSTAEAGGSILFSTLAIFLPFVAALAVLGVLYFALRKIISHLIRKKGLKTHQRSETTSPSLN